MTQVRWLVIVVLLGTAAVFQSAFIPALGIRMHTSAVVFVVALALAQKLDLTSAVVVGGVAGLLVDLMPPAVGAIGINASLGVLAAAIMYGWSRATSTDTAGLIATLGIIAGAVMVVSIARSTLTSIVVAHVPLGVGLRSLLRDGFVAVLVAPLIMPAVDALTQRPVASWSGAVSSNWRRK